MQLTDAPAPPAEPPPATYTDLFDEEQRLLKGPSPRLPEPPPPPDRLSAGFGRFQVGLGPPGFSRETSLLRLEGYGGPKLWLDLDAGYMFGLTGRHVGAAVWGGLGRWHSPGNGSTPGLTELEYLVGLEIPVRLGTREIALFAAPRIGVANGTLDFGNNTPAHPAFVWGLQASAVSSRFHSAASVSYLSARIGPPGMVGRDFDLGGLYFSVGVLIDDG
jgi:hypothetical protein